MNDLVEQLILEVDKGLRFCTNSFEQHKRDYPAKDINENKLSEIEKKQLDQKLNSTLMQMNAQFGAAGPNTSGHGGL